MLISFTVTNFRSFHEEQTLSMVANRRIKGHEGHLRPIPTQDEKLLPVAIFYGANGAGKSNLVKAIQRMKHLVVEGSAPKAKIAQNHFALGENSQAEPTKFEIRILARGHLMEYGFALLGGEIHEEWLVLITGKSKEQTIFERTTVNGKVTVEMPTTGKFPETMVPEKIRDMAKVGALPNQLFLNSLGSNIQPEEQGDIVFAILRWFSVTLTIIEPESEFFGLANILRSEPGFMQFANGFHKAASTGLSAFHIMTKPLPPFPRDIVEAMENNPENAADILYNSLAPNSTSIGIERADDGSFVGHFIHAEFGDGKHAVVMPFSEQSDGTRRITHLLPALYAGTHEPCVFIIDEIDRSLHPLLARKFVEQFLAQASEQGSQLILTTHDTNLLDLELFRRDEIWFAEKKPPGETHLYSLADFKVRTDLRVDKGYLLGRFGAIPFLGPMGNLFEEPATPEATSNLPV